MADALTTSIAAARGGNFGSLLSAAACVLCALGFLGSLPRLIGRVLMAIGAIVVVAWWMRRRKTAEKTPAEAARAT